ncbi:hypothetical protein SAMN04489806_0239 [Paramicrobacterium humi]|uniref:Uncharacterized protein n=1 Tax=Paramicrobacterium humi TaxID=640635 RepID=A0A1H4ISU9_9MICO|nr:hypothetical protein [Microbacterium humi]SEB37191.1 hypothetical protein SAMN04489806_0239 [Microbacterium humi]
MRAFDAADVTLFGVPWDGAFVAALIAAAVSAASWYFLSRQVRTVSSDARRTENYHRYLTAINLVYGGNPGLVDRGLDVLEQLTSSEYNNDEDKALAISALDAYTRPRSTKPGGGS